MKKANTLLNILLCAVPLLWAVWALLCYQNYTRHVELFAANGWLWYTEVLAWGKWALPLIALCLITKCLLRRK